ncbi:MAG: DoxX family protein [Anaerolineales bacterium]|nr:DoxX family protein [Anaerolineales bacterium]
MNIILWIAQGLLGLGFIAAGYNKAFRAQQAAVQPAMAWMSAVSPPLLRFIGLAEIAGGLGVLLPMLSGVLPWLTPVAAASLALVMVLASGFHFSRKEYPAIVINTVLLLLALFVAWGRWDLVAA